MVGYGVTLLPGARLDAVAVTGEAAGTGVDRAPATWLVVTRVTLPRREGALVAAGPADGSGARHPPVRHRHRVITVSVIIIRVILLVLIHCRTSVLTIALT
jgi:hypothetical protein